jgi:sulfite reductase (NADPH) flavoprotein alpha-component
MADLPVIPESAPFSPAQRAWLNGFFAGLVSGGAAAAPGAPLNGGASAAPAAPDPVDWPWHDPTMPITERMGLAEGKPIGARLMAAMAQMDCGRCGYDCHRYAEAITNGAEAKLNLCVPGGKETHRAVKMLVDDWRAHGGGAVGNGSSSATVKPAGASPAVAAAQAQRQHAVNVRLISANGLNQAGSEKDTRHVVLDLEGSGFTYEPGDSLGIYPENDPGLVAGIVAALGAKGDEEVISPAGHGEMLTEALTRRTDLSACPPALCALLAEVATHSGEANTLRVMAAGEDVDEPGEVLDVLDLLTLFPSARPTPAAFLAALNLLQPRLYSISSSQRMHPDQVHLTVAVVRYTVGNRERLGVASTFLAERAGKQQVPIFLQRAHAFRLPSDAATPVVMVGPGTGVAPFRAFLEERRSIGAKGRNWLFFGNPHQSLDFLYRDELQAFHSDGLLTRLDTAFSRDQAEKVYVQHAMQAQATELWRWVNDGAHFYVCGDANRMARDVDLTLKRIAAEQGKLSPEKANEFVAGLAKAGRYQRDVY